LKFKMAAIEKLNKQYTLTLNIWTPWPHKCIPRYQTYVLISVEENK
jgi:hypothetical protein